VATSPVLDRTQRAELAKAARREEILEAARRVFAARGFRGTTIADVAEEAGTALGTIYLYFPSKEAVFGALEGTIYEEARRQMGEAFDPSKGFAAYEDALAHVYYRRLLEEIQPRTEPSRLFREFVRREIDILNVKTLLRVWQSKAEFDRPVFLQGGLEFEPEDLLAMTHLDLNGLLGRLSRYSLYEDIATALRAIGEHGVAHVERTLEKSHLKAASRYSHIHPLSVLPILDFLARKTREVENIRIIARGKEHGIPVEAMKELLVI